jgi:hypothetical protein
MFPSHGVMVLNLTWLSPLSPAINIKYYVFHTSVIVQYLVGTNQISAQQSKSFITIIKFEIRNFHKWKKKFNFEFTKNGNKFPAI